MLRRILDWLIGLITGRAASERLGRAEQKVSTLEADAAAATRVKAAEAGPRGRDVTQKEMGDGTF